MSSISTSLCEATAVSLGPVVFQKTTYRGQEKVFATQRLSVTLHDGNNFVLCIHLAEGVTTLAAGEVVVFPSVGEVPA